MKGNKLHRRRGKVRRQWGGEKGRQAQERVNPGVGLPGYGWHTMSVRSLPPYNNNLWHKAMGQGKEGSPKISRGELRTRNKMGNRQGQGRVGVVV